MLMPKPKHMTQLMRHSRDPIVIQIQRLRIHIEPSSMCSRVIAPLLKLIYDHRVRLHAWCMIETKRSNIVRYVRVPALGAIVVPGVFRVAVRICAVWELVLMKLEGMARRRTGLTDLVVPH